MNKKISILGAGESGVGAALLAQQKEYQVFLSDLGTIKPHYKKQLGDNNIPFEEGKHTFDKILDAQIIVKSPGIPPSAAIIKAAQNQGLEIISEIEFASRFTDKPIIAITGSNGKTTTTLLTHHILSFAKINAGLGGNIGHSFAALVAEENHEAYVLELSSFQLEDIKNFRPKVACILNISPDHLDRYEYDIKKYASAKWNITQNQKAEDYLILPVKDDILNQLKEERASNATYITIPFSSQKIITLEGYSFDLSKSPLQGPHNVFNTACAIQIALKLGVEPKTIKAAIATFKNAPHRLELFLSHQGIHYVNDSKATNVEAVYYALQAMPNQVIWIAGGTDKGNDYTLLDDQVKDKVRALVCMGLDNEKLEKHFFNKIKIIKSCQSIKQAVAFAQDFAQEGDTVLLSPACASFDLFKNYEDRGTQFKQAVFDTIKVL